jgi:plasmid stabilization system protein ParE
VTVVLWTPAAREDLQGIYDYIANDSTHYAGLVVDRILLAMGRIQDFPESGRVVPELNRVDVREVLWRNYRIVYRLTLDYAQAHVLTVFRAERLFANLRLGSGGAA